jgi:hypothetical protein
VLEIELEREPVVEAIISSGRSSRFIYPIFLPSSTGLSLMWHLLQDPRMPRGSSRAPYDGDSSLPVKGERKKEGEGQIIQKKLKIKVEITKDVKYLWSFLFVLWTSNI